VTRALGCSGHCSQSLVIDYNDRVGDWVYIYVQWVYSWYSGCTLNSDDMGCTCCYIKPMSDVVRVNIPAGGGRPPLGLRYTPGLYSSHRPSTIATDGRTDGGAGRRPSADRPGGWASWRAPSAQYKHIALHGDVLSIDWTSHTARHTNCCIQYSIITRYCVVACSPVVHDCPVSTQSII